MREVYFDNNATTRIAPEVLEEMEPFLREHYGNPSSAHLFGARAKRALLEARERVASFLNVHPEEVVFTSCGTESDNAAIRGVLEALPEKRHIITTRVEHPAVLNLCRYLEERGYRVTYLSVDRKGMIDLEELREAISPDTALISIMYANNETGVIFPVKEAAEMAKERGVVFHCDAVQAVGKVPLDLGEIPVDLLSLSGHKFHAPKGVGALIVRKGTPWIPFIIGGHQEGGKRGGTENVASIVGLGKACELAKEGFRELEGVRKLRDRLEEGILERIPQVLLNGDRERRVPNTTNLSFVGIEAESIVLMLSEEGIAASSGAACSSDTPEPSHVLQAMGVPPSAIQGTVRFSLSRYSTGEEVDYVLERLPRIVEHLRSLSPLWPPED